MTAKAKVVEAEPGREVAVSKSGSTGIMRIIELAHKLEPEKLKMLMDLQERYDATEARKAFDKARAQAKAEIPVILKNRRVGFDSKKQGASRTDYRHEDLGEICRTIDPILSKYGLSYYWETDNPVNEPIVVACVVTHELGHSVRNTLRGPRDDSGNKNPIQAIGSTVTYLQRYSLKAALGLAASNDDDGLASGDQDGPINDEQVTTIQSLIVEVAADITRFCRYMKVASIPEITTKEFPRAVAALEAKRQKS